MYENHFGWVYFYFAHDLQSILKHHVALLFAVCCGRANGKTVG